MVMRHSHGNGENVTRRSRQKPALAHVLRQLAAPGRAGAWFVAPCPATALAPVSR